MFLELVIMLHQFNSLKVVFDICWTFFLRRSLCVITSYFIALLFWDFLQWAKAGDLKLVTVKFMGNHEAHMWRTSFEVRYWSTSYNRQFGITFLFADLLERKGSIKWSILMITDFCRKLQHQFNWEKTKQNCDAISGRRLDPSAKD